MGDFFGVKKCRGLGILLFFHVEVQLVPFLACEYLCEFMS